MARLFTNLAYTTLAADAVAAATSLTVATSDGALFPTPTGGDSFDIRIFNKATGNVELASVTTRTTDTFSVVARGQYSTTALDLQAGDLIELVAVAAFYTDLAQKADIQGGSAVYAALAGGTTAYTITLNPVPTGYGAGMHITGLVNATNTGSSTLNVNSLGAKTIKKLVGGALTAISAGDMVAGTIAEFRYDGTDMELINPNLSDTAFLDTGSGDSDVVTGTILKNTLRTFTKTQVPSGVNVGNYSGAYAWDLQTYQWVRIVAQGNVTINVSGGIAGMHYRLIFIQDGTGSRTLTITTGVADEGWPGVKMDPNACTIVDVFTDGFSARYAASRFSS